MHRLFDYKEAIEGLYYEPELTLAQQEKFWIDKVIKRQIGMALVSRTGYPEKINSWIPIMRLKSVASCYLLLPSNVSGGTLLNFKVRLPDRITLDGEWDVALVEISYQNTWYDINTMEDNTFSIINFAEGQQLVQGNIALNNYESIYHLIYDLCAALQKLK